MAYSFLSSSLDSGISLLQYSLRQPDAVAKRYYAPFIQHTDTPVHRYDMEVVIEQLRQIKAHTDCLDPADPEGAEKHTAAVAHHFFAIGGVVEPDDYVDESHLRKAQQSYRESLHKEWKKRADIAITLHGKRAQRHLVGTANYDHRSSGHVLHFQSLLRARRLVATFPHASVADLRPGACLLKYRLRKNHHHGSGSIVYSAVKQNDQEISRVAVKVAIGPCLSSFYKTDIQIAEFVIKEKTIMATLKNDFVIKAFSLRDSPCNVVITELEPCSLQQFFEFGWLEVSQADADHVCALERPTSKSYATPGWFQAILRCTPGGSGRIKELSRRGVPPLRPLPRKIAKNFAAQIFLACQYLHSEKVAWDDLRCGNVVVTSDLGLKVIDFGQAHSYKDFHPQYHRSQELPNLQRFASDVFFLESGMGSLYHRLTYEEMEIAVQHVVQQEPEQSLPLQALLDMVQPFSTGKLSYARADCQMRRYFGIGPGNSRSVTAHLQTAARDEMDELPNEHLRNWFNRIVEQHNKLV